MNYYKIKFILIVLVVVSCSLFKVRDTGGDPEFKLSNYKTYNFYDFFVKDTMPESMEKKMGIVKEAISNELKKRGLKKSNNPELLVNIGSVIQEKIQTRPTTYLDAPVYIGQRRYSWKSEDVEVGRYKQGTVSLHLIDKEMNKLMWKGAVEGVIPENPERIKKEVVKGMEKLFKEIP